MAGDTGSSFGSDVVIPASTGMYDEPGSSSCKRRGKSRGVLLSGTSKEKLDSGLRRNDEEWTPE
jgi:hypothetical protein